MSLGSLSRFIFSRVGQEENGSKAYLNLYMTQAPEVGGRELALQIDFRGKKASCKID